jgi:hypothetical protein
LPVNAPTRENLFYDVTPKVVPADRKTVVEIRPRYGHVRFDDSAEYSVRYVPTEEIALRSGWSAKDDRRAVKPEGGVLRIEQYFEGEQEHVLLLERRVVDRSPAGLLELLGKGGDNRTAVADFRVYSVAPDLFARRPFKGDLHMHSYHSDGKESPAYVAGACRRIGMDFMAVTDHRKYAPSLEAQKAYEGVELDLRIFPGEEVHPPEDPVHIINFGGRFSINELFADKDAFRRTIDEAAARLPELPPGVDRYEYASTVWCFDKIREAGGLGIFCHPFWFTESRYSPAGALTAHLFKTQPFDAYEVIGGYQDFEFDSNTLQAAWYHDQRALGRHIPIVGVSDAHGCENRERGLFGWYYTIVFARSTDLADLVESIKDLWSVAIEAVPGDRPRPVGPMRLVKYALFLLREILPQHDELCVEEGRLMLAHAAQMGALAPGAEGGACPVAQGAAAETAAAMELRRLKGRTRRLMDRYWAAG